MINHKLGWKRPNFSRLSTMFQCELLPRILQKMRYENLITMQRLWFLVTYHDPTNELSLKISFNPLNRVDMSYLKCIQMNNLTIKQEVHPKLTCCTVQPICL